MKKSRVFLLALLCLLLTGCRQNPSEEALFSPMIRYFEARGFTCELERLEDAQPEREVPIYNASVWHRLLLSGEELLVYFDESNRADYLSEPIDESVWGTVARFGLRFVLVYPGENPDVTEALLEIENI